MDNNLVPLIRKAKAGDEHAMSELHEMFIPLLKRNSFDVNGRPNEDCYQDLTLQFLVAVHSFDLTKYLDE